MRVATLVRTPSGFVILTLLVLVLALYHETLASMVAVWLRSDTFAHGALVFPVCAWLAWRRRAELAALAPQSSPAGLVALTLLVAGWLVARLAGVLVAEQLALVAMIPALVWAILGRRALSVLAFPLAFLAFAVPFGEGLIPVLMEFTADFTVRALELTGVPVYREGLHFSIPSGDFEVATACSGIRYLIASLALGTLYAHLTYYTWWRRALFMALALLVPLVANGVRAYLIVMIAYWSDMRLAVGVDHLIYGWIFFGLVMFALFGVGLTFRERTPPIEGGSPRAPETRTVALAPAALAALTLLIAAPLAARQLARAPQGEAAEPALPVAGAGWRGPLAPALEWRPSYLGAAYERLARYEGVDGTVQVAVVTYAGESQGAELINSENLPYDKRWSLNGQARVRAPDGAGDTQAVRATRLLHAKEGLLVWHWYVIGAHVTASEPLAKLYQAWETLRRSNASATMIAIATPEDPGADGAKLRLAAWLDMHSPALARCVRAQAEGCER